MAVRKHKGKNFREKMKNYERGMPSFRARVRSFGVRVSRLIMTTVDSRTKASQFLDDMAELEGEIGKMGLLEGFYPL